jgi:hypothetical protein
MIMYGELVSRNPSLICKAFQGFDSRQGQKGFFFFATASRPALGLTQPPIQGAPVTFVGGEAPGE